MMELYVANTGEAALAPDWQVEVTDATGVNVNACLIGENDAVVPPGQWGTGVFPPLGAGGTVLRTFALFVTPDLEITGITMKHLSTATQQDWFLDGSGNESKPSERKE